MKRNTPKLIKVLPLSALSIALPFVVVFSELAQANGPWVLDEGQRGVGVTFVNETGLDHIAGHLE